MFKMVFSALLCQALFSISVRAETPAGTPQLPQKNFGKSIEIFDDKIFDLENKEEVRPKTSVGASGKGRTVDYTSGIINEQNRQKWLNTCSSQKSNPSAYRDCYSREKEKTNRLLQGQRDAVEGKQSKKLKNMPQSAMEETLAPNRRKRD